MVSLCDLMDFHIRVFLSKRLIVLSAELFTVSVVYSEHMLFASPHSGLSPHTPVNSHFPKVKNS